MTARPRVLLLAHNHPSVRPGGAEEYTVELHAALREHGEFDSVLVARGPGGADSPMLTPLGDDQYLLSTHGEEYDHLRGSMRRRSFYTGPFADVIGQVAPDLVHIQHTWQIGYPAIRTIRYVAPLAPIVHTLHEFMPICHRGGQMVRVGDATRCSEASPARCHECFPAVSEAAFLQRERMIRSALALVDRFIAPSAFLRDRFVDWGLDPERVVVEEYGRAVPSVVAPVTRRERRDRFGFFGQLTPFKGVDVLLEAADLLTQRGTVDPLPSVSIHGANLELQPAAFRQRFDLLRHRAGQVVTLRGSYDQAELPGLMADVDWVVVPSIWWENSPLVIQEAFAHGRPVICSDVGGMAEKVSDGVSGIHFRAGDASSLADVMARATSTPGLWDELRAGIPAVHSMADHVGRITSLYRSLLATP